jgi:predicted extracellular nuclease
VQEEDADTDDDPLTSEGLFVFDDGFGVDVTPGDVVRITGTVDEFFGETQLDTISAVEVVGTSALPGAAEIDLPAAAATTSQDGDFQPDLEAYEGMLVRFPETLTITEQFQLDRFNEIKLVAGERPYQFTQTNLPSVPGYAAFLEDLGARTITYDDGLNVQNAPISDLDGFGPVYGTATAPRMGDTIEGLSGVLSYQWAGNSASGATWRVRATEDGENAFESANPREPEPEDTGGRLTVASFNVLNFFTTLDTNPGSFNGPNITGPNEDQEPRGAEDLTGFGIAPATAEFDRQLAKLLTAIEDLSADVLGLIEIENDPEGDTSIQALIDAINEVLGPSTYDYIDTGTVGTDAIKVGLIYRPDSVTPVGDYAILDKTVDERFDSDNQRPTVAQSFAEAGTGEVFTVAVNHLKSKGSPAGNPGDEDIGDGQAASNGTRTEAAEALVDWLATDPTGSGDPDFMIIGDLNAYAMEDPIRAIAEGADDVPGTEDDYTDLAQDFVGPEAYSYLFDGQLGTLDYALANGPMAEQVTGVTEWHINSDEADALDYNLNFGRDPDIFDASVPYRASDHDPVVVGLDLGGGAEPVLASAGIGFDTGGFLPRLVYSEDGAAQESVLQIPYVRLRDPQDAVPISVEAIDSEDSFSLFGREFSLPVRDWATVRLDGTIAVRDGEDGAFGRDARSIEGDEALAIAIGEDAPFDFAGGAQIRLSGISAHETVTAEAWLDGALVGSFASAGDTIEIAPAEEGLDRIVLRADGDTDFTVAAAEFRDLFAEDSLLA